MQLNGDFNFNAPQEQVWQLLMDPAVIAAALPGVDELVPIEGEKDTWRAEAKINLAAVSGTYAGVIHMSEQQPPRQYRLTVSGEGQQSIINGSALITLNYDETTGQTRLTWEAEPSISGKLARVGQRLIKAAATMLSKQFFTAVAKQLPS